MHAKYVDDITILESINLKKTLEDNPDQPFPDSYHTRTGHTMPPHNSKVYNLKWSSNTPAITKKAYA